MAYRIRILLLTLLVASCNRQHKRIIGVVPQGQSHLFWQSVHAGAVAASRENGVEILWNGPPDERDFNSQIKIGVFSDYPPELKLQALGVAGRFSVVLCSADPEIGRFKPHPRGFLVASARWQLDPSEVLVVGDRSDADAAGAAAAGMPCVIVGKRNHQTSSDFVSLHSLERLRDVLDDDHRR